MSKRVLLVAAVAAVAFILSVGRAGAPEAPAEPITVELEKIKETRTRQVAKTSEEGFGMFDAPGLELRFALRIPEGRRVVSIGQPTSLIAVDDAGADLSKLPKLGWGDPKHVQLISEWEKPPHALDFKLALPTRAAQTFTLSAALEAVTFTETHRHRIEPGRAWMPLEDVFELDELVEVRVEVQAGAIHLAFKPGSVREHVESVVFEVDERPAGLERQGVMWNPQQVSFMFAGAYPKEGRVTAAIEVRRGLATTPVKIELTEIELP